MTANRSESMSRHFVVLKRNTGPSAGCQLHHCAQVCYPSFRLFSTCEEFVSIFTSDFFGNPNKDVTWSNLQAAQADGAAYCTVAHMEDVRLIYSFFPAFLDSAAF